MLAGIPTIRNMLLSWQELVFKECDGKRGSAWQYAWSYMKSFNSSSRLFDSLLPIWFFFVVFCVASFLSAAAEASRVSSDAPSYQYFTEGLLFDKLGEYERAADAYRKALGVDSSAWDAHYRLALDYLRLKDFKNAERQFLRLLKLKPYEERVRYLLALVYSYRSKYDEAASQYHELLKRPLVELNEHYIRNALGYLYLTQEKLEKAQAEYETILKGEPNNSDAHFYLGYIHAERTHFDKAVEEFTKAIALDANHAAALNSLSYVYAERGEHLDQAFALVKKALEIEPSNGAFLDTLGWVYFKKGDLENARRSLENASVFMRNAEVFDHLGDVYRELGMFAEAKKNWQAALAIEPKRKEVREKLRQMKTRLTERQ